MRELAGARKAALPPGFVHHHRNRIGQIEAAVAGKHRYAQSPVSAESIEHVVWKPSGFGTENQSVTLLEPGGSMRRFTSRGRCKHAPPGEMREALLPVLVHNDTCHIGVVEACARKPPVVKLKPERLHKMQRAAGVDAEPDDVAGIRRNLRLIKHNVKHRAPFWQRPSSRRVQPPPS